MTSLLRHHREEALCTSLCENPASIFAFLLETRVFDVDGTCKCLPRGTKLAMPPNLTVYRGLVTPKKQSATIVSRDPSSGSYITLTAKVDPF